MIDDDVRALRYEVDQLRRRTQQLENTKNFVSKDGTFTVYDASGNPIIVMGKQSDSKYNLSVFDTAGVLQTRIGELSDGSYGVEDLDAGGTAVLLSSLAFGQGYDEVLTSQGTTSTSYTDLATVGPTVTLNVGATGKVIAVWSAITTLSATGASASVAISIDGGAPGAATGFVSNFTGSGGSGACAVRQITGLSAGSHTFRLKYLSSNGAVTATFQNRSLLVLPF